MSNRNKGKRVTIYDISRETGVSPSSVSKALNDLPTISSKIKALVHAKAKELNYKHNTSAANLRRGSSRTIGIIVPKINVSFFADAIAGVEEACFENNHRLIICQSDETFAKEVQAVETLIHHNVDCILISLSIETASAKHLKEITDHHLHLVQFDRVDPGFKSHTLTNDNRDAAYKAVKHLIDQGYKKIALLGGTDRLTMYSDRKKGYLQAMKDAGLDVPHAGVTAYDNALTTDAATKAAEELLRQKNRPDAFFTTTDYSALGVLKAANAQGLKVPQDIGIVGFSNEYFTEVISPTLSSVDQKSRKLGKAAANVYFDHILKAGKASKGAQPLVNQTIESSLIVRGSSLRTGKAAPLT